jgi:hypothetical protein
MTDPIKRASGLRHGCVAALSFLPYDDGQYLAGQAEARTTTLYDRWKKKVTRNIVERLPI